MPLYAIDGTEPRFADAGYKLDRARCDVDR